jgi:cytoskeletal protein RodZ
MTGIPKAWVNFNGTGTVAIRDSFNVSSITDGGTGRYTVNFTTAMPNANYGSATSIGDTPLDCVLTVDLVSTSSFRITSYRIPTGVVIDAALVSVAVFSS